MLSSLLKISNTAEGLTASPKISHDLLATLGVKPGSLNFQQLMNSRLGALNSPKNGTASLKVGLDEEHLDVSELFIAELAPLFDQIKFGPVFNFQQSVFSNQLSTHSFRSSALGSQLSATQVFGVIKELIEGSGKLPVKANNLGQKIELNVESIGKNAGKKVSSVAPLAKVGAKITPSQAAATVEKVVEAVTQASAKVSGKLQFGLQTDSLGDIEADVEISTGKPNRKLTVDSNSAKNLLSERLGRGIQNLDIRVKEVGTSKRGKGFDGQFKLNSKLTTSVALKKFRQLMDVLLGSATPVKSQTAKVSNSRRKASSKLSKNKVSARGKNFQQDSRTLALQEDKLKLKNDVSSSREFLGEILENIEGDSGEFFESILSESERPTQPVLTSNNVNFDFLGGKLVGSGTVERSHLPQMLQRILEFANSQSNTAGQKLQIQLDVEKLGSLLVDAVKQKDKINLHINVDNSEVRRMLETQLRPLLDQMIKEGIEVGKLEVSVKNENADSSNEWQTAQNEREFRKQNSNLEHPISSYAKEAIPVSRQRDFGYNSMEVLA